MYEVLIRTHFSSAHHLVGYRGRCEAVHGHNWEVEVAVRGETLNRIGILMDFRELRTAVDGILSRLDHADLNRHPAFRKENPTSENIARYLHEALSAKIHGPVCRIHKITVFETTRASASYWTEPEPVRSAPAAAISPPRRKPPRTRRSKAGKR
jgi:6-pyruvoyltetrahydropterin/6-carboxytetrahydropterin synthase